MSTNSDSTFADEPPLNHCRDVFAPSMSPLETKNKGDLGMKTIQTAIRAGKMMQTPLRTLQSVEQLRLMNNIPQLIISCIIVPSAPLYLVSAISEE